MMVKATSCTGMRKWAIGVAFALVAVPSMARPDAAFAVGFEILKPHRAVYDVELETATERSGIDNITGRIVYEMTGDACDGLSVNYRFVSRINANGEIFTNDQRSASHESADGRQYTFLIRTLVDEQPFKVVKGMARVHSGRTLVSLAEPEQREVNLDEAQFISSHLVSVIENARKGRRFFTTNVFDGGDDADEVLTTTNVIGEAKVHDELLRGEDDEAVAPLRGEPAWPVTVGYFHKDRTPTGSTESLPVYEVSFLLYEGGVSRKLVMRYPDYAIRANLVSLEFPDETGNCGLRN